MVAINKAYETYHSYCYRTVYELDWQTVHVLTRVLFWGLSPELRRSEVGQHQNIARVSP